MQVVSALNSLEGDLAGKYFPLTGMSEADRLDLVQSHFLFKRGDRFLESAGANRDWPGMRCSCQAAALLLGVLSRVVILQRAAASSTMLARRSWCG
jgi:hypothetical protein